MTRGSESNTNILSTTFVVLVFVNLAQSMGQQMMVAVVPLYAYDLGASASLVGAVVGAFAITALAVRPFAGPAFDSFSKKKMLCASFAVMAAATFFYGLSTRSSCFCSPVCSMASALGLRGRWLYRSSRKASPLPILPAV